MALTDADVREILRIIDTAGTREIRVQTEGFSLHVIRDGAGTATAVPAPAPADDDLLTIESPMLGMFYRAEAPGEPPFVEVGSIVEPDTIVCIIEVMKMMNSVPAGVAGKIVTICSENARLVEFGEPLFRVEAA
jgi:acetyl-CoA carboxylase biotin carboxyl carrier protein